MSKTKRWIEGLLEKQEFPAPIEVRLIRNSNGPPYKAHCPNCNNKYESTVPIPEGVICQHCYMTDVMSNYKK